MPSLKISCEILELLTDLKWLIFDLLVLQMQMSVQKQLYKNILGECFSVRAGNNLLKDLAVQFGQFDFFSILIVI